MRRNVKKHRSPLRSIWRCGRPGEVLKEIRVVYLVLAKVTRVYFPGPQFPGLDFRTAIGAMDFLVDQQSLCTVQAARFSPLLRMGRDDTIVFDTDA